MPMPSCSSAPPRRSAPSAVTPNCACAARPSASTACWPISAPATCANRCAQRHRWCRRKARKARPLAPFSHFMTRLLRSPERWMPWPAYGLHGVQGQDRRRQPAGRKHDCRNLIFMASTAHPTRDDFAKLLELTLGDADGFEGRVVHGTVTGIENDMAVIDVGLKSEGRVPLREFAAPGQKADLTVGAEVEVYVARVENAMGEAMLSRDSARREAARATL